MTAKEARYSGSIGIDKAILKAADIFPGEKVSILNMNNGERFETYAIEEAPNSGKIIFYGPAVRKGEVGDELVMLSFCLLETKESHNFKLKHITLGKKNQLKGK